MKILISLMCVCYLLPVQSGDMDRYADCESCLTTAQEIEKAMKAAPDESRQAVVKNLIRGDVCEKLLSYNHDHVSKEKMASSCKHLLETHRDQFHAVLLTKEPKRLDIVLCYEQSRACVGVKRQSFKNPKTTFTEKVLEALLQDNKEHVRFAQPVHSGSPVHSKDEL